jgi:hypothetical protein
MAEKSFRYTSGRAREKTTASSFRYSRSKKAPLTALTVKQEMPVETEEYTGIIDGLEAKHGEENLFKQAYKTGAVMGHWFRVSIGAPRNMPGWKELDFLFLLKTGEYVAIQVRDYEFVHKGLEAEGSDMASDMFVLQELAKEGISVRGNSVISIDDNDLLTPELAKHTVQEILL